MSLSYSIHHSFSTELAKKYGIEEAILIHHFQYWIAHNKNLNRNFKEGRTWSFQTVKEIQAWFPYMSPKSVLWTLNRLVELKILLKKNFNKNPIDKTSWYAFVDEDLFMGENSKNVYERQKRQSSDKNGKAIPDTITSDTKKDPLPPPLPLSKEPEKEEDFFSDLKKKLINSGRDDNSLISKAFEKYKDQPLGKIVDPLKWLLKVYDTLAKQKTMDDLVEIRKKFVRTRGGNWIEGKDKVTVMSGSLEKSYSYRGCEEFWEKHGLSKEGYLKHLNKGGKDKTWDCWETREL